MPVANTANRGGEDLKQGYIVSAPKDTIFSGKRYFSMFTGADDMRLNGKCHIRLNLRLTIFAALVALCSLPVSAADYNVSEDGTLAEAIAKANANADNETYEISIAGNRPTAEPLKQVPCSKAMPRPNSAERSPITAPAAAQPLIPCLFRRKFVRRHQRNAGQRRRARPDDKQRRFQAEKRLLRGGDF